MKETKLKGSVNTVGVHVSEFKLKEVDTLRNLFSEYDTIALVDLTSLPSPQLQIMRSKLKNDNVLVKVTKKRLIKKALENFKGKKGIEEFVPFLDNVMPALIFSRLNAFRLSSFLRKNRSKVAAKPGQIAPKDLVVNAGPTPFAPGPMIGELGSLGVKSAVEQGKIVVKKDTVVVKQGEMIKAKVADLLAKLGIKPMEIGLSLVAAYEDGIIVDKEVLNVDDAVYVDEIKRIAFDALRLTIGIGYITKENIKLLLVKANSEAEALIGASGILTDKSVKDILGKANEQAEALVKLASETADELKESKEENLKKEKSQEKSEGEEMGDIVDNASEKIPSVRELAEKKKQKLDQVPDLYELAKKNKKVGKVPSAHELAEKKKGKEEK